MTIARRGRMFDHTSAAQAFAGPERVWISYGRVDEDSEDGERSTQFDEEDGQIYVNVTLKPSDMQVRARVGMIAAGPGEAVYFPLISGDEVLVAMPEGDPRAGPVIVARLNNSYDPFPRESVAGFDPATNGFGVFRTRSAMTFESGQSIMLRSAAAGAFLRLDARGNVTLRDGASGALQMSPDVFGYQSGDGARFLQLDLNEQRFNVKIGQASILLAGDLEAAAAAGTPQSSYLVVPGNLVLTSGGLQPNFTVEHALSTEAAVNFLSQLLVQIGVAIPGPLTGAGLAAAATAILPLVISTAAITPLLPLYGTAIQAAFLTQPPKGIATAATGQLQPGIGSASLLVG